MLKTVSIDLNKLIIEYASRQQNGHCSVACDVRKVKNLTALIKI